MIVGLGARVSDRCEVLEVVNEKGLDVLRLEVEVDFEVLRLDDESEVLLRLDDADVFDTLEVVRVVDGVDEVPESVCDDCEFVDVGFELEELLRVLIVLAPVRVGLAFADRSARVVG